MARLAKALGCVLCAAIVGACSSGPGDPSFPAHWDGTNYGVSVELNADGSGTVDNLPLWQGGSCELDNTVSYSGAVAWKREAESYVISGPVADIFLWADDAPIASYTWSQINLGYCGKDTPGEATIEMDIRSR